MAGCRGGLGRDWRWETSCAGLGVQVRYGVRVDNRPARRRLARRCSRGLGAGQLADGAVGISPLNQLIHLCQFPTA